MEDRNFLHFLFVLRVFALGNKGRKLCEIDFFQFAVQIFHFDFQLWTVSQNCDNGSKRRNGGRKMLSPKRALMKVDLPRLN